MLPPLELDVSILTGKNITMSDQEEGIIDNSDIIPTVFVCEYLQCGSKIFKRKGDLTRHQKLHNGKRKFQCTVRDCRFSFSKNNKLLDHIRAGHDKRYLCLPETQLPGEFTSDILSLHVYQFGTLRPYRKLPIPKCSFCVRSTTIDDIRQHLLEKHDVKGRKRSASFLHARGYDYKSADIV